MIVKLRDSLVFAANVTCFVSTVELFNFSAISCSASVSPLLVTNAFIVISLPTSTSPEETLTLLTVKPAVSTCAGIDVVEEELFIGMAVAVVDAGVDAIGELSVGVVETGGIIIACVVVLVGNEGLAINAKMVK